MKNLIIQFVLLLTFLCCKTTQMDACEIKEDSISGTNIRIDTQRLLSKEFEIHIPAPFRVQKDADEEGIAYYYSFVDGAIIIVFQGAMTEFAMDRYVPQETTETGNRKTSVGIKDNKYWRKDVFSNIRVYYSDVPHEHKDTYDRVLNEMKVRPIPTIGNTEQKPANGFGTTN